MLRTSFLFIACSLAVADGARRSDFAVVRPDGIGPVRVGMSLAELNKTLHTSYTKPTDPDEQACTYVGVPHQPGVGLMILDGRVARIEITNRRTQTSEGIRNGDSEADALKAYGKRLTVAPSFYSGAEGHYLTLHSADKKFGIRFETYEGRIDRYYAGTADAIEYVEGCE